MAEGRAIEDTEAIRIDILFLGIIVITLLFEKLTHFLDKNLKGRTRRGLRHAVHAIEEELLALGLISLLLIVAEEYLLELCVKDDNYTAKKDKEKDSYRRFSRKLLAGDTGDICDKGEEPFWSAQTIHQTHIFIFLVAVIHVLYATVSVLLCLWRMRRWKRFELQPDHALKQLKNTHLMYGRNTWEYWFWSFWAQFSPAVDESLYLSMRCLFVERMQFPEDFDFYSFVVNTLVEEFAIVARTDWVMWLIAALWILVPPLLLVSTAAAVLIVLVVGTKLEVIGVKLTQMTYLAYGDRAAATVKPITVPNTLITKSVKNVAHRLSRFSGSSDVDKGPHLATHSLTMFPSPDELRGSEEAVRRVHSFGDGQIVQFEADVQAAMEAARTGGQEITAQNTHHEKRVSDMKHSDKEDENAALLSCCGRLKKRYERKLSDSEHYSMPDSANLFWFKQPQLMLRALRFVYFETAMAIAVVCFDGWQSSDFIVQDTDFFGDTYTIIIILIAVGVLCLLHTSFLMLPTYALTMIAGSHCPETVLKNARKMHIETGQVMNIDVMGEKSFQEQIHKLEGALSDDGKSGDHDHSMHGGRSAKAISSLVGAMYRGRLERLRRASSIDADVSNRLALMGPPPEDVPKGTRSDKEADGPSASDVSAADDEEMRGIIAIFGSFSRFLQRLSESQNCVRMMTPAAIFNFDCDTGTYDGRDSTPYDRAAINLTWDIVAAKQESAGTIHRL